MLLESGNDQRARKDTQSKSGQHGRPDKKKPYARHRPAHLRRTGISNFHVRSDRNHILFLVIAAFGYLGKIVLAQWPESLGCRVRARRRFGVLAQGGLKCTRVGSRWTGAKDLLGIQRFRHWRLRWRGRAFRSGFRGPGRPVFLFQDDLPSGPRILEALFKTHDLIDRTDLRPDFPRSLFPRLKHTTRDNERSRVHLPTPACAIPGRNATLQDERCNIGPYCANGPVQKGQKRRV